MHFYNLACGPKFWYRLWVQGPCGLKNRSRGQQRHFIGARDLGFVSCVGIVFVQIVAHHCNNQLVQMFYMMMVLLLTLVCFLVIAVV